LEFVPDRSRSSNGKFAREVAMAERDSQAWVLRAERMSYAMIGQELGMTAEGARQAVRRYASSIAEEKLADVRKEVLEQLDMFERELVALLRRPHYVVTKDGDLVKGPDGEYLIDDAPIIASISTALKVIRERARLLGLDAPAQSVQRVEVITHDAFMAGLERLERELAELEAGTPDDEVVDPEDVTDAG